MERETPWVKAPPAGERGEALRQILEDARAVEPFSASQRALGWWRIADAASSRASLRRWYLPAGAVLAAVAVWIVAGVRLAQTRADDPNVRVGWATERLLPSGDVLEVAPGAAWSLTREGKGVALARGSLRVAVARGTGEPLHLTTPHGAFSASAARFLLSVDGAIATVHVFEGRVVVRRADGRELAVFTGETIRSDDPRLGSTGATPEPAPPTERSRIVAEAIEIRAPAPTPALEAPVTTCDSAGGVARAACLERASLGGGLAAETALYALALEQMKGGEDARPRWTEYRGRFPEGVFAPEVSLFLMTTHATRGNRAEALREADGFLRRYPEDPRIEDVEAWRDALADAMKLSGNSRQEGP